MKKERDANIICNSTQAMLTMCINLSSAYDVRTENAVHVNLC